MIAQVRLQFTAGLPLNSAAALLFATVASAPADLVIRPSGDHGVRVTLSTNEADLQLNPALVDQTCRRRPCG